MAVISNIVREVAGLFIDDLSLGVATAVLLGAVGIAKYVNLVGGTGAGLLLCCGLAAVILENVLRSTRVILREKQIKKI
jgi:hypothetical protein